MTPHPRLPPAVQTARERRQPVNARGGESGTGKHAWINTSSTAPFCGQEGGWRALWHATAAGPCGAAIRQLRCDAQCNTQCNTQQAGIHNPLRVKTSAPHQTPLRGRMPHLEAQARPRARLPLAGSLVQRNGAVGAGVLVIDGSADVTHLLRYALNLISLCGIPVSTCGRCMPAGSSNRS